MHRFAPPLLATLLTLSSAALAPTSATPAPGGSGDLTGRRVEPAGWHLAVAPYATARVVPGGSGWSDVDGGTNQTVNALAVGPDGAVYVAGQFTEAGGVSTSPPSYLVAKWDGTEWTALGGGNDWIFALAVGPGGAVYAGGRFTEIGGVSASRFAYYNPDTETWHALGVGFNNPVQVIALGPDGCIYAGGGFRVIDGDPDAQNLARTCTEEVWEYVGGGTSDAVYDLAFDGTTLYVGGSFGSVGPSSSVAANRIAAFDLDTGLWSAVGDGVTQVGGGPVVYAVEIGPDGDLYAGGTFDSIGGVSTTGIARWDGAVWHAVGGGISGSTGGSTSVQDLVFDNQNRLYVGGSFTQAGATGASGVARWTGTAWEALDVGVGNGVVVALAISTPYLYAGGGFSDMGGVTGLNYLAKWEGVVASAAEPGVEVPSGALVLEPAFPNPFARTSTLRFTAQRAQAVRLELFDALGRRVAVLHDGVVAAGQPVAVVVDGRGLPAGAYVARLVGEDGHATRLLKLVR